VGRIFLGPVFGMLISPFASVVVGDLDVIGVPVDDPEANSPLVVDGDGVLAFPVAFELVKAIAGRNLQVVEAGGLVDVLQLSRRSLRDLGRETPLPARRVQLLGVPVRERLDRFRL
jgi:hypothetical protein